MQMGIASNHGWPHFVRACMCSLLLFAALPVHGAATRFYANMT